MTPRSAGEWVGCIADIFVFQVTNPLGHRSCVILMKIWKMLHSKQYINCTVLLCVLIDPTVDVAGTVEGIYFVYVIPGDASLPPISVFIFSSIDFRIMMD